MRRLGEIADITGGGTPSTGNELYWNGDINWFTPTEINKKYLSSSERRITSKGLKKSSAKLLPVGTILFTSRATIAEIGFATQECSTNQGFQSLIVKSNFESEYVYHWIIHNKKIFFRRAQGSTFAEISSSEIKKVEIKLPCQKEQQKISKLLESLDKKAQSIEQRIEKAQSFKKGLLQQMFV